MAMRTYRSDRTFSDGFLPLVRNCLASVIASRLREGTFIEDAKEATDLRCLVTPGDLRVAVRIRRPGYVEKYPFDVTFRLDRASGAKTEHEKVLDGMGDWFFYGHAIDDNPAHGLGLWWLIDLAAFRHQIQEERQGLIQGYGIDRGRRDNNDPGGTAFMYYDVRSFRAAPAVVIGGNGVHLLEEVA